MIRFFKGYKPWLKQTMFCLLEQSKKQTKTNKKNQKKNSGKSSNKCIAYSHSSCQGQNEWKSQCVKVTELWWAFNKSVKQPVFEIKFSESIFA